MLPQISWQYSWDRTSTVILEDCMSCKVWRLSYITINMYSQLQTWAINTEKIITIINKTRFQVRQQKTTSDISEKFTWLLPFLLSYGQIINNYSNWKHLLPVLIHTLHLYYLPHFSPRVPGNQLHARRLALCTAATKPLFALATNQSENKTRLHFVV